MLKPKPQYFGYLMWRTNSLEKSLMLGKTEGRRRRGVTEDEMVGWHRQSVDTSLSKLQETVKDREAWRAAVHGGGKDSDPTEWQNSTKDSRISMGSNQSGNSTARRMDETRPWMEAWLWREESFRKERSLCGLGVTIVRRTARCSRSVDGELHHSQRRGFQVGVLAETCLSWGDWGPGQGGDLGPVPPVTACVTEPGPEPSLLTPSPSLFAWIILCAPGHAFPSESSPYSVFSAWQAAKSLELLHVTVLPSAEWDMQVFTWGDGSRGSINKRLWIALSSLGQRDSRNGRSQWQRGGVRALFAGLP